MEVFMAESNNRFKRYIESIIIFSVCTLINSSYITAQKDYERNFFFNTQLSFFQQSIKFNSVLASDFKTIDTDFNIGYKKVGILIGRRYSSISSNFDSLFFVENESNKYFSTNLAINYLIFDFKKRFNIQLTGGINFADRPYNFQTDYFFSTMLSLKLTEIFMEFPNRTLLLTISSFATHLLSTNFYSNSNTLNSVFLGINIGFSSLNREEVVW